MTEEGATGTGAAEAGARHGGAALAVNGERGQGSAGPSVPHGGALVDRVLRGEALAEARRRVRELPVVVLGEKEAADLELIATGAYSPLTGFMGEGDYAAVVEEMRLADGLVWSLPVTLAVPAERALTLRDGDEAALADAEGRVLGLMRVEERFEYDRRREARLVFRTEDEAHPGVARLYRQGEVYLGGPVWLLEERPPAFPAHHLPPARLREVFAARGWRTVVGFQTRNPIHRAHEYLQKCALETVDGLLVHPLVGATKDDDVPAEVRMASYRAVLERYYPAERVVLAVFPAAMRYAGPREAVFHAIVRKNYGCTHFIVGRDHAGVGSYYGTYDAQRIFAEFRPEDLGITPLFFENAFYCRACGGMATTKTCPHGEGERVTLSGTRVRAMLRAGELPPPEFSRPEVARILAAGYGAERTGRCEAEKAGA